MNFQNIPPIERPKVMLDLAFRKARERGKSKKLKGNWLEIVRKKEALKLDVVKDTLVPRLQKMLSAFPGTIGLPMFYVKLMKLTLDFGEYKKSCGAINWAIGRIRTLHKQYVSKIVKTKERYDIKDISKQFYGRVSSILKQIDSNLQFLENARKTMRTYPDIKEMFTVCIYGFPNVGKTTLLNKITGTKARTAAFAFTTKTINAGYFTVNGEKIQVLDVPGTLARKDKMNFIELQAELVMKELADVVVYVFDLSEQCGYSVRKQQQLLQNLGKKKKVLVYLSKQDLLSDEVASFTKKHYTLPEIKREIGKIADSS